MNKFITCILSLVICSLTSCSLISGLAKNPDDQDKEKKVTHPNADSSQKKNSKKLSHAYYIKSSDTDATKLKQPTGRVVDGFMEPDVSNIPDNKDLQESNNVSPIIPVTPLVPSISE